MVYPCVRLHNVHVCVVGLGEDTRGNYFESLGEITFQKIHHYAWHIIFSYYQLSTIHIRRSSCYVTIRLTIMSVVLNIHNLEC